MKKSKALVTRKKGFIVVAIIVALVFVNAIITYAAVNGNVMYIFTIKPSQANSVSDSRLRSGTNTQDAWKVLLAASQEGHGTITRFWLERPNNDNVSVSVNAKATCAWDESYYPGTGIEYYRAAYTSANNVYVHLAAENNNNNNRTYRVWGFWDEETGKKPYYSGY